MYEHAARFNEVEPGMPLLLPRTALEEAARRELALQTVNVTDQLPKLVVAPKLPVPVPSRIEMLLLPKLAAARSSKPSPLKSLTATERGEGPVPKSVLGQNAPVETMGVLFSRIETVLSL